MYLLTWDAIKRLYSSTWKIPSWTDLCAWHNKISISTCNIRMTLFQHRSKPMHAIFKISFVFFGFEDTAAVFPNNLKRRQAGGRQATLSWMKLPRSVSPFSQYTDIRIKLLQGIFLSLSQLDQVSGLCVSNCAYRLPRDHQLHPPGSWYITSLIKFTDIMSNLFQGQQISSGKHTGTEISKNYLIISSFLTSQLSLNSKYLHISFSRKPLTTKIPPKHNKAYPLGGLSKAKFDNIHVVAKNTGTVLICQ